MKMKSAHQEMAETAADSEAHYSIDLRYYLGQLSIAEYLIEKDRIMRITEVLFEDPNQHRVERGEQMGEIIRDIEKG